MKKRILAAILAAAMLATTGCSFKINGQEIFNQQNQDEDDDDEDDDKDKDDKDEKDQDDDVNPDDGALVEPEIEGVYYGPDYVTGFVDYDMGGYDVPLLLMRLDRIFIVEEGYDELQSALNSIFVHYYDQSIGYYNYDMICDISGGTMAYEGETWEDNACMYVRRNDTQMFSLAVETYSYLGGAHPYDASYYYNFDPATGKELELKDVVNDYDGLEEAVVAYLKKLNAGEADDMLYPEDYKDCLYPEWEETVGKCFDEDGYYVNWIGQEDSVIICFNGYTLAPWASGPISVEISMEDYPEIFSEEYFHQGGTTMARDLAPDFKYSEVVGKLVVPLSYQLGKFNYDDCYDFVESEGFDFTYHEPYEAEDSGLIIVQDPATGYKVMLNFWGLDPFATTYSKETDALYYIDYTGEDYNFAISNNYNQGETTYYLVDYSIYKSFKFYTLDEYLKVMGILLFN